MPPEKDKRFCAVPGSDLSLNVESGIYYVTKQFRHRRIPMLFKTTREKDFKRAKKLVAGMIIDHINEHEHGQTKPGQARTVSRVIEEIQRTETPGLRSGTQENRTAYFKELGSELGHMPIDRVTIDTWSRWLVGFKKKKNRKTFWDYAKHMNILIRYAYEQKYISHLITLPNPDPKKITGTVLSPQNIRELWSVMNDDTRDQLVLAYENCMRLREVLYLTWERIDLESGEITLRAQDVKTGSKTGRGRTFVASEHAIERLRARWAKACGKKDFPESNSVFPSPTGKGPVDWNATAWARAKRMVTEGDEKKGVAPINPAFPHWARWHDLRHSSISHMLLDKKMNPLLVSEFAGVSMQTIQRIYLHSTAEKTKSVSQAISILGKK